MKLQYFLLWNKANINVMWKTITYHTHTYIYIYIMQGMCDNVSTKNVKLNVNYA